MRSNKKIAVVLPDTLLFLGLQSLFDNYFPEVEVCHLTSFKEVSQNSKMIRFPIILRIRIHLSCISIISCPDAAGR